MNLISKGLLYQEINQVTIKNLKSGDFVEFHAVLHKNPIVDILTWIKAFGEMIMPFASMNKQSKNASQQKNSAQVFDKKILSQIDAVLKMVTPSDSIELIGELKNDSGIRAVITCQLDFFNRSDPNEIIDGEFYVIGKVVKVIPEKTEAINLLRKTPLGRLDPALLSGLTASLSEFESSGFQQDVKFTTSIEGPSFLVVPIAIFL